MRRSSRLTIVIVAGLCVRWKVDTSPTEVLTFSSGVQLRVPRSIAAQLVGATQGRLTLARSPLGSVNHQSCLTACASKGGIDDMRRNKTVSEYQRDASEAWLDEQMRTADGKALGRKLFLGNQSTRKQIVSEGLVELRSKMKALVEGISGTEASISDGVFLAMHYFAAQTSSWLGSEVWSSAIMNGATVPGLSLEQVASALQRDLPQDIVSAEEIYPVVNAFVDATWGQIFDKHKEDAESLSAYVAEEYPHEEVIAASPQFASIQYSIGILWGYSLRGLVLRLALDRQFGTTPDSLAVTKRRLEMQFLSSDIANLSDLANSSTVGTTGGRGSPLTLFEYASEFFGHSEWVSLCNPSDAAIAVFENELEEVLASLVMLAEEDYSTYSEFDPDDAIHLMEDEGQGDGSEEVTILREPDWQAFQRRAVALGALLADAETFVAKDVGKLKRGNRPASNWVSYLVTTGALSGTRRQQGLEVAGRIYSPIQRLVRALRDTFLQSKLRSARRSFNRIYQKGAAST